MSDSTIFVGCLVVSVIFVSVCGALVNVGWDGGEKAMQKQAITRGFAEYQIDTDKNVTFVWHTNIFLQIR